MNAHNVHVSPAERHPQPPAEVERAWADYGAARRRAELSGAIGDAIMAGQSLAQLAQAIRGISATPPAAR